jgi:hypothetical protein
MTATASASSKLLLVVPPSGHRSRATSSDVGRWSLLAAVRLGLAVVEVSRRTAELGQLVDQLFEVRHRPGGERVAVVPGRSQELEDLVSVLEQPSQRLVLAAWILEPYDGEHREPDLRQVDVNPVAAVEGYYT